MIPLIVTTEMQVERNRHVAVYLPPDLKARLESYAASLPEAWKVMGRQPGSPSLSYTIRAILDAHLPETAQ